MSVDVGTPPPGRRGWDSTKVRFHGFADLPAVCNHVTTLPHFSCLGRSWSLSIYPGGWGDSDLGMVSAFLDLQSNGAIRSRFSLCVKGSGGEVIGREGRRYSFWCILLDDAVGYEEFAERSRLMAALDEGTLVVRVQMTLDKPIYTSLVEFVPENPSANLIQRLFMDEETADIFLRWRSTMRRDTPKRRPGP